MKCRLVPVLLLFPILAAGCTSPDGSEVTSAAFDEVFVEADRITLEEPPRLSITRLRSVHVGPDGRVAVTDAPSHSVRIHRPDGSLEAVVGREGEGPGEFRAPVASVLHEDGSLFVFDSLLRRLTRFAADLSYDTAYVLSGIRGGGFVVPIEDDLLIHTVGMPFEIGRPVFLRYDRSGRHVSSLHPQDSLHGTVPYWRWYHESAAVADDRIYVANEKTYPLLAYRHDGTPVKTFGTPPPSWRQASHPAPGEFGADRAAFESWFRTHTWIDALAVYGDSLLVVSHGSLDPEETTYREYRFTADVYRTDSTKLWEDIPLPGRLMAGGEMLTLLVAEPPEGWVLGRHRIRGAR